MAIYTKISKGEVKSIERKFNLGKIISFKGIKKGIENTIEFVTEHHLILKPAAGRFFRGVAMESTSCLLHNRRNGFTQLHGDMNQRQISVKKKPKTSVQFLSPL